MFEAWQAQQKAQKDEERKAKSEAAAALQNYRRDGLSEEERKLAEIRERERLQKLEAERKLRDYRAQMSEEEARLFAQKQEELRKKQRMEEQLRTNGVVSAHEAGIHASLKEIEGSGAVKMAAAQYTSPQREDPPQFASSTRAVQADGIISHESNGDSQFLPDSSCALQTEQEQAVATKVSFMFGLITTKDETPQVDGYLAKADQIVKTIIAENQNCFAAIASTVEYPVVTFMEKDSGECNKSSMIGFLFGSECCS
jgi:hypothetical protein